MNEIFYMERMMSVENDKGYLKKEGAQIVTEFKIAKLINYISHKSIDDLYVKNSYQRHFVVPDIGESTQYFDSVGTYKFKNSTLDSSLLFWLSYICYKFESHSFISVGETFDPRSGDDLVRDTRYSFYSIHVESLVFWLEKESKSKWNRAQKRKIKDNFLLFLDEIEKSQFVKLERDYDVNSNIESVCISIHASTYKQINRELYKNSLLLIANDFRRRSIVSIFVHIEMICRKGAKTKLDLNNVDGLLKENGITTPNHRINRNRLGYYHYSSDICFIGMDVMAKQLQINRKTVVSGIRKLSEAKIISFALLRRFSTERAIYFITDIYSEQYLFKYLLNRYASSDKQELIELMCSEGYLSSQNNIHDTLLNNGVEIDTNDDKFSKAGERVVKGGFYRDEFSLGK